MRISKNDLVRQFNNEPLEQEPDPNKEYYYLKTDGNISVNVYKTKGLTYLMKIVLLYGKHPQLIQQVKNYKHQINTTNSAGYTALEMLSNNYEHLRVKMIREFLKYGANVDLYVNDHLLSYLVAKLEDDEPVKYCEDAILETIMLTNNLTRVITLNDISNSNIGSKLAVLFRNNSRLLYDRFKHTYRDINFIFMILNPKHEQTRLLMDEWCDFKSKHNQINQNIIKHRNVLYQKPAHFDALLGEYNFIMRHKKKAELANKLQFLCDYSPEQSNWTIFLYN